MPEVLDQSEVDALLAAVDSGTMEVGPQAGPTGVASEDMAVPTAEISIYDFKRPERVSKDQLRSLESMHEVFARNFGASLSGYLRTIVDVKLASVEQLTYSEFIMSLPNPTCFNLLSAKPLEGELIFEINPSITFNIIERLLGAGAQAGGTPPERPLTDIELMLIKNVTDRAVEQLKATWANVTEIDFQVVQVESNPQLMQIVAPNEPVVLISFEVSIGEVSGMINFCIPFLVIEPVTSHFSAQTWFGYSKGGAEKRNKAYLQLGLEEAIVDCVAELAETYVTVRDLINLKPGDILMTNALTSSEVVFKVEGRPKFSGKSGVWRNHKALKLMHKAT